MSDLETERANAALEIAKRLLPPITDATSREDVATALAAGRDELVRLVSLGELSANQSRPLLALLEINAEERLRDFPTPGAPQPVGLFGKRTQ
jgi:hypothetical protein